MRQWRTVAFMVLVVLAAGQISLLDGQEKKKADDPPVKLEPLEKLQADAVKSHPDVKVAEAKLRLAEAELEQARALIKARVAAAHADLAASIATEKECFARKSRADLLFRNGAISSEEHGAAVLTWIKLRNERVAAEQNIRILVGPPAKQANDKK